MWEGKGKGEWVFGCWAGICWFGITNNYVLRLEVVGEKGRPGEREVLLVLPLGLVPAVANGALKHFNETAFQRDCTVM